MEFRGIVRIPTAGFIKILKKIKKNNKLNLFAELASDLL
jgi:hypothetical protein